MSIRILIADELEITREGIKTVLDVTSGMEVIAQAKNGRIAVKLARELRPDVVVMDIEMPGINGIDAARHILHELPNIKIVAFSTHLENRYVREMFKAGASGYVSKYSDCQELITAIKTVVLGQIYLSPRISSVVTKEFVNPSKDDASPYSLLTVKERQVLQLIAEGKTTKKIALELSISTKAVEWRRGKIMQKLNMQNIVELIKYAIREGVTGLYA